MSENDVITADFYFAQIPEWVLYSKISAQAVRLYAVLHRYADKEGTAFPSRKTLAGRLNMTSPKTVDAALKELIELGAITSQKRFDEAGDQTSNLYTVRFAPLGVGNKITPPSAESVGGGEEDYPTGSVKTVPTGREENDTLTIAIIKHTQSETDYVEAERLANLLADLIFENKNNQGVKPKVTKEWIESIEKMHRLDKIEWRDIELGIRWCQKHEFWHTVILSTSKYRLKYGQMYLVANRDAKRSAPKVDGAIDEFLRGVGDRG